MPRSLGIRPPQAVGPSGTPAPGASTIGGLSWYAGVALASAVAAAFYLLHTPPVPDLAAQVARAHIAKAGAFLWWDGWFGGMHLPSYSAASPFIMNILGVHVTGAIAAVAGVVLAADLLRDTLRPRAGTLAFGVAVFADVISGRVTFALGLAFALGALVLLRRKHTILGTFAAAATFLASPLAGLFLGLILLAVAVVDRVRRGTAIAMAGTLLVLGGIVAAMFPGVGQMPYPWWHMLIALASTTVVIVVCPDPRIRMAGVTILVATGVLSLVPGAVGTNVVRLLWLVAAPVVVSCATLRGYKVVALMLALSVWPSIDLGIQLHRAGSPSAHASFYQPLVGALTEQSVAAGPVARGQRVEVIDPATHWPAVYVAPTFPLARGWDRQADRSNNALFYDGSLTSTTYHAWLSSLAVGWVALPVHVPLDYAARQEARLVATRPSYLRAVWSNESWQLYRVVDARPLVRGAALVKADKGTITFRRNAAGLVHLQVRWSRYVSVRAAQAALPSCVERDGDWTAVRVGAAGTYTVGTRFSLDGGGRAPRCVNGQLATTAH